MGVARSLGDPAGPLPGSSGEGRPSRPCCGRGRPLDAVGLDPLLPRWLLLRVRSRSQVLAVTPSSQQQRGPLRARASCSGCVACSESPRVFLSFTPLSKGL